MERRDVRRTRINPSGHGHGYSSRLDYSELTPNERELKILSAGLDSLHNEIVASDLGHIAGITSLEVRLLQKDLEKTVGTITQIGGVAH